MASKAHASKAQDKELDELLSWIDPSLLKQATGKNVQVRKKQIKKAERERSKQEIVQREEFLRKERNEQKRLQQEKLEREREEAKLAEEKKRQERLEQRKQMKLQKAEDKAERREKRTVRLAQILKEQEERNAADPKQKRRRQASLEVSRQHNKLAEAAEPAEPAEPAKPSLTEIVGEICRQISIENGFYVFHPKGNLSAHMVIEASNVDNAADTFKRAARSEYFSKFLPLDQILAASIGIFDDIPFESSVEAKIVLPDNDEEKEERCHKIIKWFRLQLLGKANELWIFLLDGTLIRVAGTMFARGTVVGRFEKLPIMKMEIG